MKKKTILVFCIASVMSILLSGCCLSHEWQEATCTTPKTCAKCGETEGEALGHEWQEATCTEAKTCSVCGETEGEALGHKWQEATCTEAKTCSVCGETEGTALGHKWQEATCTKAKTCSECGETEGEALGHEWKGATCTEAKTCFVCGETEGKALGHEWQEANCQSPKTCRICWTTEGNIGDHIWVEATCLAPKTCSVCGEMIGEKAPHNFSENGICTVCGASREIQLTMDNVNNFFTVSYETEEWSGNYRYTTVTVTPTSNDYIFEDVQMYIGYDVAWVDTYGVLSYEHYDRTSPNKLSLDNENRIIHVYGWFYYKGWELRDVMITYISGTCIRK